LKRGFYSGIWLTDEGDDCAIGAPARIDIQQANALYALDCVSDGIDYTFVATVAEIGNTLDQTHGNSS
jgi:hypothetical protein